MSGWSNVTLGDVLELKRGYDLPTAKREAGRVSIISSSGPSDFHSEAKVQGPGVITGRYGTIGQVFFTRDAFWPLNTALYVRDFKGNDPRFCYYFLKTLDWNKFNDKSGVPGVNRNDAHQEPVLLPPVTEQREIASILGALDDKIELNRRMAATLEEMARALYRSWFVDFDPVKAKAEGLAPAFMDESTAALFPDRFGDDGLPDGWTMRRLGDILTLNYGKALKKDIRQAGPFPVYGSGGSNSSHIEALVSSPTVIVGRKGTVGSIFWSPRGCWPIDTTYYASSPFPMVYALHTLRGLPLSEMNTDAAVPGLNRENAYRLVVPFPGEALISAFADRAASIQEKVDTIDQEVSTLGILRDTLLPKLMSGELRVGEVQDLIEEVA